ncbi:MAG: restriction endonuclease subunit S, partial [Firmicutes bacterium]|nr:restriction endonuclease subunit S [Bacillota bacterium]
MSIGKLSYDYKDYSFPENWDEYRLSQLLEVVERPVNMVDDQEYDLITIKRNFGGIESRGKLTGDRILVKSQFEICEGDFVISKRQIVHGACAVVSKKYEGATVSNEYDVMNCKNGLLSSFFNYYVQLPFIKRYFYTASDGVHIEKLRFKTCDWLKQKVRIPAIIEQQKIVSILATWDKAIELKERLISEKKQQKKWLMQNLLTGKKRLPGFTGEWQEVQLGDVCNIIMGQSPDSKAYNEDKAGIPLIQGNADCHNRITKPRIWTTQITKMCNVGDIILTVRAPVGTVSIADQKACIGRGVSAICSKHNQNYMFQYLLSIEDKWAKVSQGSTFDAISGDEIKKITIKYPSINEQTAIAEVLSAADREIDLHEKQLEELKKQKKALMQLLLTGIVRV